jgi:hypothetical protein
LKDIRPRITEKEQQKRKLLKHWDNKLFKLLIISDTHGWLADLKAVGVVNKVLQNNHFNEVVINGDCIDMPYISGHAKKLYEDGILQGYSEIGEIEYTKEQILKPLRLSTDAKIVYRLGNHDERITSPKARGQQQAERLNELYKHYRTTELDIMLGLKGLNIDYDPNPVRNYFNCFDVVHGLSLTKNAPEKNIYEYFGSGSSGHTHRLGSKYINTAKGSKVWAESGHLRVSENVEYMPTAKTVDWQQGFVEVNFLIEKEVTVFTKTYPIHNGRVEYNGILYEFR